MRIRVLFRQIQQVPTHNADKQRELAHRSDLAALRLGMPLPVRYRPFTGNMDSRMRIHEREYDSIAEFTRLHLVWRADPVCQRIDSEWNECHDYERSELLYVDDPNDAIIPWIQMAAEPGRTIRYTVNEKYTMPDGATVTPQGSDAHTPTNEKMRVVYRQTQKIPFDKWLQELELERATDEEEARLGHPLPPRYRYFSGAEHSQIRVHVRAYDDFAQFGRLFEEWADDEVCQKMEVERHNFYEWEREELLYVDPPIDVAALRRELGQAGDERTEPVLGGSGEAMVP